MRSEFDHDELDPMRKAPLEGEARLSTLVSMLIGFGNNVLVHILVHANLPCIIRGGGIPLDPQILRKTQKRKGMTPA